METTGSPATRDSQDRLASQGDQLWKFFAVLLLITIPFWVFGGSRLPIPVKLPVSALAAFNPLIAACILTYLQSGTHGIRGLFRKIFDTTKIQNKAWYIPIVFLPPLISVLAYALMRWRGMPLPDPETPLLLAPVFFAVFFVFGIGEELGWTGYALDPLQKRGGALTASVLLGLVWAIYHLIPDLQNGQAAGWILWHRTGTIVTRILMVWLYNNTGRSVFSAILFHTLDNLSWAFFPNYGSHYDPFFVSTLTCLAALAVVIGWDGKTLARRRFVRENQ